jgi:hypothetical protein
MVACAAGIVLAMWCWWVSHAEIELYEMSTSAQIELDAWPYPVPQPNLRPGGVADEGTYRAPIISSSRLIVAAQFPPRAALGRVRRGQSGLLRLDGFPWSEFGSVSVTVAHVALESSGTVRVEFDIDPRSTFRGKLVHGMPGSIEVAVERITPLALLLRTTGQALTAPQ